MKRFTLSLLALALSARAATYDVVIDGTASHPIPNTLYGMMFEDINHSADGGYYAELLRNRAFQIKTPNTADALEAWSSIGSAGLAVVDSTAPLSSALPNSLQVTVPTEASGAVGVANSGYWGINVKMDWTYKASFYAKLGGSTALSGDITVSLISSTGESYAAEKVPAASVTGEWQQFEVKLKPSANGADTYNNFTITFDGAANAGNTVYVTLASLFPPTFKDRPNGVRIDLAETTLELKRSMFRFGGNNVEGMTFDSRWKWNETVGPLTERPGRVGAWNYINTDGWGLYELLQFSEDIGMEFIASVWAGLQLAFYDAIPEDQLEPYIQEAIDQINFIIGPTSTPQGALRAQLGHPEPFYLRYVEIGNEDFFGATSYIYRWRAFSERLTAEFPHLIYIATSLPNDPVLDPKPKAWDLHVYADPQYFTADSFKYDSYPRDGTIYFELEYAVTARNGGCFYGDVSCGRLAFPTLQGAVSEAAFTTGLERNSDIVYGVAYAPYLQNIQSDAAWQWIPDLISYTADTVYRSASFYVQEMFAKALGTEYLPSTLPPRAGNVTWTVTKDHSHIYIKIVNSDTVPNTAAFTLPSAPSGEGKVVTLTADDEFAANNPTTPKAVEPVTSTFTPGITFNYDLPGTSVVALTIPIA